MTTPKKPKGSSRKSSTPRRLTDREVISSIPMASPDDPIFKNGWVIGGKLCTYKTCMLPTRVNI